MSLHIESLAALPLGIKNGVGGKIGTKLYVGLGSAGKRLFFYDLESPLQGWQLCAEFPGTERNDAAYAVCNDKLYVFSGAGCTQGKSAPEVLEDGFVYDGQADRWQRLTAKTPVGLLGAGACHIGHDKLAFIGGYNKKTFDTFLSAISQVDASTQPERHQTMLSEFMSRPVSSYGWNREIWCFDTREQKWQLVGHNPFEANCGAGIVADGQVVTVIEGEIKPGLRSLKTKQFVFNQNGVECQSLPSIHSQDRCHEGLAGHFAAQLNERIVVAGGAYFIGSQENFRRGKLYTHQGLTKHYSNQVWQFDMNQWRKSAELPSGVAYGVSVQAGDCVYLLGGEGQGGAAQQKCYCISE